MENWEHDAAPVELRAPKGNADESVTTGTHSPFKIWLLPLYTSQYVALETLKAQYGVNKITEA
jgi:hypothetical protein